MTVRKRAPLIASVGAALCAATVSADSWESAPSMISSRGFAASVVDPWGNLLVVGGMRRTANPSQTTLSDIQMLEYDGSSYVATWVDAGFSLPVDRYFHTAVCTNGFLYVIGGARWDWAISSNEPQSILQVDRYDFFSETWDSSSVPPLPFPNIGHASVVDKLGRIWVIGGQVPNSRQVYDSAILFDPSRPLLGWQTMPSLQTGRVNAGAVVSEDGRIWVIGGLSDGYQTNINTVEVLNSCTGDGWSIQTATLPAPVSNSVQAVLGADGYIYTMGGWTNWYLGNVYRIDSRNSGATWNVWVPLNLPRNEHTAVLGLDGWIYVCGGEAGGVQSQTNVEKLYTEPSPPDLNSDRDCDGVLDADDNCPNTPNADQADCDADGIGDACDDQNGHRPVVDCGSDCANGDCEATSAAGRTVTLFATATDADADVLTFHWWVSDASVILDDPDSPTPSGVFPIGCTMATVTVNDGCSEPVPCDVLVRVQDTTPPEVTCTSDVAMLWPPNHSMETVNLYIVASDAVTNPGEFDLLSVTIRSDEADDAQGNGDGATTGDVDGADGYSAPVDRTARFSYQPSFDGNGAWVATIQLRAERDGNGDGRCYTIDASVRDTRGDVWPTSCCIVVPHDRRR